MQTEHGKLDIKTYNAGADSDSDKEFLGSKSEGKYIDARNMRPTSVGGNDKSLEIIGGEQLVYNTPSADDWFCIGSADINEHVVEVWADIAGVGVPFVRIDGTIYLQSPDFLFTANNPLQIDKGEDVEGGLFLITDNVIPPMILNIQNMIDALDPTSADYDPDKYFANFDPNLYYINLASPLDIPVFVENVNVGGGGGLPPGEYEYQIRYSSEAGDRTNWSHRTQLIPIVQAASNESKTYPSAKTYGGPPNPSYKTAFAVHLRFRVTNIFNYDFIEIKRIAHNQGAGVGFQPTEKIVAKIPVSFQELSVRDFVDPADSNTDIIISDAEAVRELAYIERAKAIRYYDRRAVLMNVKLASKESNLTFLQVDAQTMFPVVDRIGKNGFSDPYNQVHRKHFMGGEKYGFAVNLLDGVGSNGFAVRVPGFENYQMPNRRVPISSTTETYSAPFLPQAADIENNITNSVHEVFDLSEAVEKTDYCSFKNIYKKSKLNDHGFKTASTVATGPNADCDEQTVGEVENHGALVLAAGDFSGLAVPTGTGADSVFPFYHPYTPTKDNDGRVDGLDYAVNTHVNDGSTENSYHPKGFGPTYYSKGMALAGIDNFPPWAKAFSIARTKAAGRVLAQGLGMYSMIPAQYKVISNTKLCTKWKKKLWFFAPDIENGIVSSEVVNDIIDNPQNYSLQFVSPLGFFSELYNFDNSILYTERDRQIDMMTYARILRDDGSINLTDINMGIPDGFGTNYVGYGKYRNDVTTQDATAFNTTDLPLGAAEKEYTINTIERKTDGRGTYLEIEVGTTELDIYGVENTNGDDNFEDAGLKNWTEPMYIINIVRTGANVKDENINSYRATTHYQKLESIIGGGTGLVDQIFQLVDERWEDCIPGLVSTDINASVINRYVYVKKKDGTEDIYVNVVFKTAPDILTIVTDIGNNGYWIAPDGKHVKGTYTSENVNDVHRFFNIIFDQGFNPPVDSYVIVKYDNTAPIRFWGGDSFIGESIFAPLDRQSDSDDGEPFKQFAFGIGFPYSQYFLNQRHYVVKRTTGVNRIQDNPHAYLGYFRQLCVMFTVESRIACHLAHNLEYPLQHFPLVNYVMRPNRWDRDKSLVDNNIYPEYADDYGPDEMSQWGFGGFRFKQQINPEYSNESPDEFFSKPKVGFVERTEFRTRTMWSLPHQVNSQSVPGLRSFPANNSFDLDDAQGEIKRAYDATTDKAGNIYAFTETGVCLLLTKKSILQDLNGGQLGYMSADGFITQEYWLTKKTGMNAEMWKSAAEGFVPLVMQNGQEVLEEAIFWANNLSVFRMINNSIIDIGRDGYYSKVMRQGINLITPGVNIVRMIANYDKQNREYWLTLHLKNGGTDILKDTFIYGQARQAWHGKFDYNFDSYTSKVNQTYGHRAGETYALDLGTDINGASVTCYVIQASSMDQYADKEFTRLRINTGDKIKPTKIEFFEKENGPVICSLDPTLSSLYLKNYGGWEQWINRKDVAVSANRDRVQGRLLIFKISYQGVDKFRIIDTGVTYKLLK